MRLPAPEHSIQGGLFSGFLPQLGVLLGIMAAAVFGAVLTTSRLAAILCLGVVGYGIAILFSFYGAPDLAMTQLVIESLTVILIALAFYHLPNKSIPLRAELEAQMELSLHLLGWRSCF